jgi:hypothetical protein
MVYKKRDSSSLPSLIWSLIEGAQTSYWSMVSIDMDYSVTIRHRLSEFLTDFLKL